MFDVNEICQSIICICNLLYLCSNKFSIANAWPTFGYYNLQCFINKLINWKTIWRKNATMYFGEQKWPIDSKLVRDAMDQLLLLDVIQNKPLIANGDCETKTPKIRRIIRSWKSTTKESNIVYILTRVFYQLAITPGTLKYTGTGTQISVWAWAVFI